jgi:molybdenum cofactor cytidylyltransferase
MQYQIDHCGIVILAAGQSKRLGRPKQMLEYDGISLIDRVIQTAVKSSCRPIALVLGASAEQIIQNGNTEHVHTVINEQWEEGMASSIRAGLNALLAIDKEMDGVIILVCDQPHLNVEHINGLLNLQATQDLPAAACSYGGILGTPALFHKTLFENLLMLQGDVGAKKIIAGMEHNVAILEFEKGLFDIDTENDYQDLLQEKNKEA